jgi:hypothetical protein
LNPYKFSPKFIAGALVPMMADYPEPWQLGFQDPATPNMERNYRFTSWYYVLFDLYYYLCIVNVSRDGGLL